MTASTTTDRPRPAPVDRPERRRRRDEGPARRYGRGFVVTLVLVALVNACGVMGAWSAATLEQWGVLAFLVLAVLAVDVVYFSRRAVPAKYLLPGLLLLLVYQVFAVGYNGWVAFTNYGDGHNLTKDAAVEYVLLASEERVEGTAGMPLTVLRESGDDRLVLAVVDPDGTVLAGRDGEPARARADAVVQDGRVTLPGHDVVTRGELLTDPELSRAVTRVRLPLGDDPAAGSLRTQDGATAYVYRATRTYDPTADTITDTVTGTVYRADDERAQFVAQVDGRTEAIPQGWRTTVGLDNFGTVLAERSVRGPFLGVLVWTVVFAGVSVLTTFALGLSLALVLDDWRVRGRRWYRSLLIVPYALPGFLSAVLWRQVFTQDFGYLNVLVLGPVGEALGLEWLENPAWLSDPLLAKVAVLVANLWMGFPYMFLVCTGAIQSLPHDVVEAARIDGAGPWRVFRSVKLPLLLVSTAPLLISSFAYSFNNFNVIYQMTGGGPVGSDPAEPGGTDILISYMYRLAFGGIDARYGLASAISLLIFLIVGAISVVGFRRTRALEELS